MIQVSGGSSTDGETVQYIEDTNFCKLLRNAKVDDDYELHENLLFFLCIHPNAAMSKIMLRKLRVTLSKVKDNSYYQTLGMDLRKSPHENGAIETKT